MRLGKIHAAPTTLVAAFVFMLGRPVDLHAQSPRRVLPPATTRWIGTSHCVSTEHPCTDEQVIYKLRPADRDSSHWLLDASRILDGDTTSMGRLSLVRDARTGALVGTAPAGTWSFRITGDSLAGTLTMNDGIVMRRAVARRR